MKILATVLVIIICASPALHAQKDGFEGRPITENLFMQTGNTLHAKEFIIGIGPIAYGITENFQIGTNVLLYLFQYINADLKYSLMDCESQAFALGLGFGSLNLSVGGGDISFISLSPYVAYTTAISSKTRLHLNGNYSYFEGDADIEDAEAIASASGTSISAGIEQSVSNRTKFVADVGYDITFEGLRVGGGVLLGWEVFRLKVGVQYFAPKDVDGLVLPYVGLWWRFDG
ncbi:MAG: hypothetical protein CL946_00080 [Ectothiorhodospiraceae bacterium]|nr:hypothetical protein [Ectothiorhodospiraceae bacterium]